MSLRKKWRERLVRVLIIFPFFANEPTVAEAKKAWFNALIGSEEEKVAMTLWKKLSLKAANQATTADEAQRALFDSPEGSDAEKVAKKKITELS